jgi:hypothetical protein
VIDFVDEFLDLTRNPISEEDLCANFNAAPISKLNIRDLKSERSRQDLRRNKVIIEFKSKGLFNRLKESARYNLTNTAWKI